MIQPIVLPAGPVLLSEGRRDSPSFAISIWFPYGSRNEAPRTRGFVHFIEHMLFKGTARRDAFSLWRAIERTGGYANGFTDRDSLCVYCCVPAQYWRLAAELMAEAAFSSTFPAEEFEKEKQVILSEILQIEDDVEETAFDTFLGHFWSGHPAAKPIAGSAAEVNAINRGSLHDFYLRTFAPSNALIAASGDFDEGRLADVLNEALNDALRDSPSAIGRGIPQGIIPAVTPPAASLRGYAKAAASQVYYFDAIQLAPPLGSRDFFALCAVNAILGEASTSRLFQRIRERLGLAYTVQSSLSFSKTEALLAIQTVTSDEKFAECVSAVEEETGRLLAEGPAAEELDEALSRLSGSFLLSLEDPEARIRRLANWQLFMGSVPEIDEERAMYLEVGMGDVRSLLGRLASAPRGRYAHGRIRKATAASLSLKEM